MRAGSDISVDRMSTTKKTGTVWGGGKTNPIIAAAKIKEQHAKKISKQMKSHGRNMNTATKKTKNPKKHENDIASRAKDTAGNDDNKPKLDEHDNNRSDDYQHKGAILNFTTCNGYSIIGDKKIMSPPAGDKKDA